MKFSKQTIIAGALLSVGFAVSACTGVTLVEPAPPSNIYEISHMDESGEAVSLSDGHMMVDLPRSSRALDSERIMLKQKKSEVRFYKGSRWSDLTPKMLHRNLLQVMGAAGLSDVVTAPSLGVRTNYALRSDLETFHAEYRGKKRAPTIVVRMSAKIVAYPGGRILSSRHFEEEIEAKSDRMLSIVDAFDAAWRAVAIDVTKWSAEAAETNWAQRSPPEK